MRLRQWIERESTRVDMAVAAVEEDTKADIEEWLVEVSRMQQFFLSPSPHWL